MKKYLILIIVLCSISPSYTMANTSINGDIYFRGSYYQAIKDAQNQGKLLLLEFSADWCVPCQWMKKTTFADPSLTKYLAKSTITMDINIDDFDGFELKETYQVRFLPTIIILNTEGEMLIKHEQSISAEKLKTMIEGFHTQENTLVIRNDESTYEATNTEKKEKQHYKPIVETITNEVIPINNNVVTEPEIDHLQSVVKKENSESGFSLQLGAFNTLNNAKKLSAKLSPFSPDYPIEIKRKNNKYKVICTGFASKYFAKEMQELFLMELNISSFIIKK